MPRLFVGVMSGTSLDGADAALVDLALTPPRTLGFATQPFSDELRGSLLALSEPGRDSVGLAAEVTQELAALYAEAVNAAIAHGGVSKEQVTAIGCHGQTVRHRPDLGYTVQLNDPALVAELTGIDVVADFRRRDVANGGQGAPLVPAFHESIFRHEQRSRAVVNIGGISNITWLPAGGTTQGFDCGPGNVLMDGWVRRHHGVAFDEDGRWATEGRSNPSLLARLMAEPFFAQPPPKSTGRELFRIQWLDQMLSGQDATDVQATLLEFTALAIMQSLDRFCPATIEIYLAGGGARNLALINRIKEMAGSRTVATTDSLGVATAHVEAMAFAWLAMKCIVREPIDLTAVTGARAPRILGAIYPA